MVPIEKGLEYTLDITGMGADGEGVGKIEGFTVFVKGAIIGETVNVKIIKLTKNYAVGKIEEVVTPSEARIEPKCSIYKYCGGCNMQHISYEKQLEIKRQKVEDALKRIGKIEDVHVNETLGMDNPYRYRNKVILPVGKEAEEVKIGFYAPRSHRIIDMEVCDIQHIVADKVSYIVRKWVKENNISVYNEETDSGNLRNIMVRFGFKTGEAMVVLVTKEVGLKGADKLISEIRESLPEVKSIIQNVNPKKTNVVLGKKCKTLWGKETIEDYIGDLKFSISPLSFFQVNPVQTEVLYGKALEYAGLTGEETVFDAYCGTGTISLFLAKKAKKVYGVEIVPEAIENANENANVNGIDNAEFFVGEAEKVIPKMIKEGVKAEVVVVDPPRKGCDEKLLEAIAKAEPRRIVYVSCDCATLARDLKILRDMGYEVKEVQPVDMFPMTAHVETVVRIEKK
ncbi:23S rRNA (uracil(1939)-C(5))-methyltransferase RlmD [Clostridium cylindrosporum]|uniref:23S rRNA (Uracil-5-)-methyltransferase RumA n=1 Tax=Clostridium cylindrosporum DSM 605 TaxID=1121307 RepID=A0A0J8D4G5_CLOCY|nr:23S rRNA (uracil(1939)-C(5))-methyltransferase RlmD [Clostridium cylindrosporum]KMT21055.1 23S rRNA (uracil-5-)-methyltransferase RumA [Clostridium cylindrosporum DSM 605]